MTPDELEAFLGLVSYEVWVECEGGEEALTKYVKQGVDELDQEKLSPLLRLKYNNEISDAVADLGSVEEIRAAFTGFQRFLYESVV